MSNVGPIAFTAAEIATYYASRVPKLRQAGREWRSPCPIHQGKRDSFSANPITGLWRCFSDCDRGGDLIDLEMELTGVDFRTAKAEVFRLVGRDEPCYRPNGASVNGKQSLATVPPKLAETAGGWREVEAYQYRNRDGSLLFEVVRRERGSGPTREKDFRQRQPDGKGGWIWNIKGVSPVLYRLPLLLTRTAETIFVCEGEKDVHSLEALGLLATCNPMGAGKWRPEYSETIRGRSVVILPDNDPPVDEHGKPHYKGQKHAGSVAADLLCVGCEVRIVEVPKAKDVSDWLGTGGTLEELQRLACEQKALTGEALTAWRARLGPADEPKPARVETQDAGSLATRRLSDIEAKPVCWLWPGRIARGKVAIIAGNPGLGKSQITASIAAVVSNGGRWPVDRDRCVPGGVIFLNAEDDPADTLRPRLEAAGADLARVRIVDGVIVGYAGDGSLGRRLFSIEEDLKALDSTLSQERDVALLVIDPITAFLGRTDSHKNAEVRALLAPLSELAARHNIAIVGVSHLTKAAGSQALMRVTGSLAFVAAARAAYLVVADPEDKARRLFLPMKNNLGPDAEGLAFSIETATVPSPAGELATSRVSWESETVSMTADEAMQAEMGPQNVSALTEAMEWLQAALADGPEWAAKVNEEAKAAGITLMTLRRAARALSVVKEKPSMKGGWRWSIPPKVLKDAEDAQEKNLSTFGKLEHLQEREDGIAELEL
jgi:hypothetical protein